MARKKIELDISQIEALAGRGLTHAEICDVVGICETTLYQRKRESADFEEAIKKGRSKSHAVVANSLFELAKSGNLGAIIWYEKTRRGMTDKQEHTHTVNARPTVQGYTYDSAVAPLAPPEEEQ